MGYRILNTPLRDNRPNKPSQPAYGNHSVKNEFVHVIDPHTEPHEPNKEVVSDGDEN